MSEHGPSQRALAWLYPAVIPVVFAVHLFVVSGASPSAVPALRLGPILRLTRVPATHHEPYQLARRPGRRPQ